MVQFKYKSIFYGAALWVGLALFFGTADYLQQLRMGQAVTYVGQIQVHLAIYASAALIAPFIFAAGRRQAGLIWTWPRRVCEIILVVVLYYIWNVAYMVYIYAPIYELDGWAFVTEMSFDRYAQGFINLLALLGGSYAYGYAEQHQRAKLAASELSGLLAGLEAELTREQNKHLRQRLGSHFVLNALSNIIALVRKERTKDALAGLHLLADILRMIAHTDDDSLSSLEDEFKFLEKYLLFQEIRYPDLKTNWEISPETTGIKIPSHILQPLVENAFKHGMAADGTLDLTISSQLEAGMVHIRVTNSFNSAERANSSTANKQGGEGQTLTRLRLEKHFGRSDMLRCTVFDDRYEADIRFPMAEGADR